MEKKYFTHEDSKVLFNYFGAFDSGEYDSFSGKFGIQEYNKGITELERENKCSISGEGCSVAISKKDGLINLLFSQNGKLLSIHGADEKNLLENN